ncbi:type 2 glycerol-3-phosphate oxidase [Mesoplasma syrphidae]|uniref:Type 2 glycerol-3-phosphate oxidase n=1 Tax=Mesoplasma syrphidae TaxID=225999 RepID=A0A2K9BRG4_9MOLU|nr:type 2 glycerol-3-phosphate oxidase [Mesoplasma syrphidae]AUF83592.1 type 2 glycerol-3-phosphate oxidase [Mesoplasma syrphidae]
MIRKEINYDICIIGAGIMGASIARELGKYHTNVVILEKNPVVADETTTGNSGLIHGGFDAKIGTLNAKLNVLGKIRYEEWFKQLNFPYKRIDSLVLAFNEYEKGELEVLYNRGLSNGLQAHEMKILNFEEVQKREPNISTDVVGALLCNSSVLIDPVALSKKLLSNAIKNNVELKLNWKVASIDTQSKDFMKVRNSDGDVIKAKIIINCAGHWGDEIAKFTGATDFTLKRRRGEYRVLERFSQPQINSVLFMVPTVYGKGVLVAPMLDGRTLVGPTAEEGISRDETRLITTNKYNEIGEIGTRIVPGLKMEHTCYHFSGSRAIWKENDDFYINFSSQNDHFINVAGIKSPGISSAPALADYVIEMIKTKIKLTNKLNWNPIEN